MAPRRLLPLFAGGARRDPLTRLASRAKFTTDLELSLRRSRRGPHRIVTVMLCDLDGFGAVNDSLGHMNGDQVLKQVARQIAELAPEACTVARTGSDEFALIVESSTTADEALASAARIGQCLRGPNRVVEAGGVGLEVTASVGIVVSDRWGSTCDELLRAAAASLCESKSDPTHGVRVTRLPADVGVTGSAGHETDFSFTPRELSLIGSQIELHYQPVVAARSERLTGIEALARWKHPSHGLLYPSAFMRQVETAGAARVLGAAVIDAACAQASAWSDLGVAPPTMSVNVSERQLDDPDLTLMIARSLERYGLVGPELALEVPESVVARRGDHWLSRIRELKDLGVSITLDDFGTGGSCLSYLRHLPADFVKFHPILTTDVAIDHDAALLLSTMNDLAHGFGLETVAKAVEDGAQLEAVTRLGCDQVQGYLVARPAPAAPVTDLIRKLRSHTHNPRSAAAAFAGSSGS